MCYGRGGTEPTLTDAALVLGRIPGHLLAGEIPLDGGAAQAGMAALAAELALSPEACAEGSSRSGHGTRPTPFARSRSAADRRA